MKEHLARARGIHDAVVRGDLGTAQDEADWLAHHWPEQILEEWVPFIQELRAAAARVQAAPELAEAGRETAAVALACGHCHQAQRRHPSVPTPPTPEGADDAARMLRHRWATDRLWEGVAFVSPEQWKLGLSAFAELPKCQGDPGSKELAQQIAGARERTEELRLAGESADDVDARARIYGDLLGTCGSCHAAGC